MKTLYEVVATKDELPNVSSDILISYDNAETFPESVSFQEKRTCMLAGIGGGNGYFGKGFCTNGSTGCEKGLILDEPTHWLKEIELNEKFFYDLMPDDMPNVDAVALSKFMAKNINKTNNSNGKQ